MTSTTPCFDALIAAVIPAGMSPENFATFTSFHAAKLSQITSSASLTRASSLLQRLELKEGSDGKEDSVALAFRIKLEELFTAARNEDYSATIKAAQSRLRCHEFASCLSQLDAAQTDSELGSQQASQVLMNSLRESCNAGLQAVRDGVAQSQQHVHSKEFDQAKTCLAKLPCLNKDVSQQLARVEAAALEVRVGCLSFLPYLTHSNYLIIPF